MRGRTPLPLNFRSFVVNFEQTRIRENLKSLKFLFFQIRGGEEEEIHWMMKKKSSDEKNIFLRIIYINYYYLY